MIDLPYFKENCATSSLPLNYFSRLVQEELI
jgi:hypothetical protein